MRLAGIKDIEQDVSGETQVQTILVIEDEADISRVIELNLTAEGYSVTCIGDGYGALATLRKAMPDLVLLDLMLPGKDGLDICREIKADDALRRIPVIMVTARGEENDIVLGLGLGAEDYVTKPFRVSELIARVKAAFRRRDELAPTPDTLDVLDFGAITLDRGQHLLSVDDVNVPVTATEFRLLENMLSQAGRVFSRELLIDIAIGDDVYVNERTIDSHVSSVRRKLGPYRGWLKTVWGVGYRFEPQDVKE